MVEMEHFSDYVIVKNKNPDDIHIGNGEPGKVQPTEPSKPADTNKPTTKPTPTTGDYANLSGVTVLMVMNGLMAVALLAIKKKIRA